MREGGTEKESIAGRERKLIGSESRIWVLSLIPLTKAGQIISFLSHPG